MNVPPVLQSIWLADNAERDPDTGTLTVSGIFDQLVMEPDADTFRGPFVLYFGVSGLHGRVRLHL